MKRFLELLFALLVILTTQTMYMKLTNSILPLLLPTLTATTLLMLLVIGTPRFVPIEGHTLFVLFVAVDWFLLIPALHIVFLQGLNYSATARIALLYTIFFILCVLYFQQGRETIQQFFLDFEDLAIFTTTVSMFFYFIGQVFHWIQPTGRVFFQWGGLRSAKTWYGLLFTPQGEGRYHQFTNGRFTGIFSEAPIFAIILSITLILMLFVNKRKLSLWKMIILGISIYASASTTAFLMALLALSAKFLIYRLRNKFFIPLKFLFNVVLLGIAPLTAIFIIQRKTIVDYTSMLSREVGLTRIIQSVQNSPIYGSGFKTNGVGVAQNDVNTILQLLYSGGWLFILWFFVAVLLCGRKLFLHAQYDYFVAFLLYLLAMLPASITFTPLFVVMIAIFISVGVKNPSHPATKPQHDKLFFDR